MGCKYRGQKRSKLNDNGVQMGKSDADWLTKLTGDEGFEVAFW